MEILDTALLLKRQVRLITNSSDIIHEGIFTPAFITEHPEYRVNHFIEGRWYEEPFNEDDIFTDLGENEYPEFVAVSNYPNCIYRLQKGDYERLQKWTKFRENGIGTII